MTDLIPAHGKVENIPQIELWKCISLCSHSVEHILRHHGPCKDGKPIKEDGKQYLSPFLIVTSSHDGEAWLHLPHACWDGSIVVSTIHPLPY